MTALSLCEGKALLCLEHRQAKFDTSQGYSAQERNERETELRTGHREREGERHDRDSNCFVIEGETAFPAAERSRPGNSAINSSAINYNRVE